MKRLLLVFVIILSGCSTSDNECKSKCKFTKDFSSGQFFYMNIPVDCKTNAPSQETLNKIQSTQTGTVIFCGCD